MLMELTHPIQRTTPWSECRCETRKTGPSAKIVDLDPEQQFVSEIYGLQLNIGDRLSPAICGEFEPVSFADMWWRRRAPYFQSVISPADIDQDLVSRFLRELTEKSEGNRLSVKFVLDMYVQDRRQPNFTYGRIFGTIGPYREREPRHFVPGRYIRPISSDPSAPNPIYCVTSVLDEDRKKLFLDFANALPIDGDGALQDIGDLLLVYFRGQTPIVLGEIPYREANWYETTAGVCELPKDRGLSDEEISDLKEQTLSIFRVIDGFPAEQVGSEHEIYARADRFTYRMSPGDEVEVQVYVSRFGQPFPNHEVIARRTTENFGFGSIGDREGENELPDQPQSGQPERAFKFDASAMTDANGVANFKLSAADPGKDARFLDGQIYGAAFFPVAVLTRNGDVSRGYKHNPHHALSVLVWEGTEERSEPTWEHDIKPIMTQYHNLYPVMKGIANLSEYEWVVTKEDRIKYTLSLPVTHPSYMPITRDLSPAKRDLILRWFETKGEDGKPLMGEPVVEDEAGDALVADNRAVPVGARADRSQSEYYKTAALDPSETDLA